MVNALEIPELLRLESLQREIALLPPVPQELVNTTEPSELIASNIQFSCLLEWCSRVCALFKKKICNFTDSFSDGKAFCFILHYYHPEVISVDEIGSTTSDFFPTLAKVLLSSPPISVPHSGATEASSPS